MPADTPSSPAISHVEWGRIEVQGHAPVKDAKCYPGGARAWDWNETGTRHVPGIQVADVQELVERGATVVVLAQGMHERLQVAPATLEWLEKHGVAYHVLPTPEAVERYNALRREAAVGGLFHTTC